MNEFKDNNKVVQANQFITQTHWEMSLTPLKLFKILVSCLDTKKADNDGIVRISKKDLYSMFDYKNDNNYTYLREQMEQLQDVKVKILQPNGDVLVSVLVPNVTWRANEDIIECEFNNKILSYLLDLKKNYLSYDVSLLKFMTSKYSIIIYEVVKSLIYEPNKEWLISVEELRRITGTQDKYKNFNLFKTKVLETAQEEINQFSDIVIRYDTIKTGRKITKIKFYSRKKKSYNDKTY